ncbi:MAG: acetylxylan esterase [Verrucomicrobiota bacterium]
MNEPALLQTRNGFSRMILDDQIARARELHEDRAKRLAAIKSRRQAEAYRDTVSVKIARCFGKFPKKTPLNARITGVVEHEKFTIEKLVFESRPGFLVTAALYVPKKFRGPAPAILGNCGHDRTGKASDENQAYSQEMAQSGFVVLTFDPIAQGERDQYLSLPPNHPLRTDPGHAHTIAGQQLQLTGEFLGAWMVWDGMRALDYLLTRPEVDPARVGVTGNSGGGCLTTWLWALESRLCMAAPSCWINSFLAVIENEVGGDAEQIPPGALGEGLEHGDFLLARVPEPAIIIGQKHDFFDRRQLQQTAEEVARIYRLFDAGDRFDWFVGENTHGYYADGRSALRKFFCRQHNLSAPKMVTVKNLEPDALHALPAGEVLLAGGHSILELNANVADRLKGRRKKHSTQGFRRAIVDLLRLHDYRRIPVTHRNLRADWLPGGVLFGRYAVGTERRMEAILRKAMPPAPGLVQALGVEKDVVIYVPHWSSHEELLSFPAARKLLRQLPVYAVEVRGIGESMCRDKAEAGVHYWMDYLAQGFDELLGKSHLGRRVFDLLKVCDLLVQQGALRIRIVARGQGSLIAAFAAALHPNIKSAELHDGPVSFADWLATDDLAWPASMCPRGVLKSFDLPDLYEAFRGKLRLKSHWDGKTCPAPRDQ